jgi:hypothetical protein
MEMLRAISVPTLTASSLVLLISTRIEGRSMSATSTLRPAASRITPLGASIRPEFCTRVPPAAPGRRSRADAAFVAHLAGAWLLAKPQPPGQEVLVGELEGRDHQPRHVDLGAGTEHDAIGVDDEHPSVGL